MKNQFLYYLTATPKDEFSFLKLISIPLVLVVGYFTNKKLEKKEFHRIPNLNLSGI